MTAGETRDSGARGAAVSGGYDALLLASFGGPEGPDEIMPFLERVTAGRGIPHDRLEAVHQHYLRMGGRSPINDQNRNLLAALRAELNRRGVTIPLVLGNRNSPPFIDEALRELDTAGCRRVLAFATSQYSSYSSCRQYREDLAEALSSTGIGDRMQVAKVRPAFDRAEFVQTTVSLLAAAVSGSEREGLRVLFTTHSIPLADATASGPAAEPGEVDLYSAQHREVANAVIAGVAAVTGEEPLPWRLVYQSRSGSPRVRWLEPDINDALREEALDGTLTAVVVPIGFVSDHIEVLWDLDTDAARTASELGINLVRVPTVGTHPTFVAGLADLVQAHLAAGRDLAAGTRWAEFCAAGCCGGAHAQLPTVPAVSA
ncbi:ferrochelatase [Demequina lutea]|uniref:Coproporphyrin III ferrochelatase n=1 Tax=Demequina lutea TaxID=431489 RepID=A0A7Y9ZBX7_9MICO|nr:ferrochelatase [Demequina lutea]NYI40526.1 ferrochelatase [Demequina lutea]